MVKHSNNSDYIHVTDQKLYTIGDWQSVLTKLETLEQVYVYVKMIPGVPIVQEWRIRPGREVYALKENDDIVAVICVAYMDEVQICKI